MTKMRKRQHLENCIKTSHSESLVFIPFWIGNWEFLWYYALSLYSLKPGLTFFHLPSSIIPYLSLFLLFLIFHLRPVSLILHMFQKVFDHSYDHPITKWFLILNCHSRPVFWAAACMYLPDTSTLMSYGYIRPNLVWSELFSFTLLFPLSECLNGTMYNWIKTKSWVSHLTPPFLVIVLLPPSSTSLNFSSFILSSIITTTALVQALIISYLYYHYHYLYFYFSDSSFSPCNSFSTHQTDIWYFLIFSLTHQKFFNQHLFALKIKSKLFSLIHNW